MAPDSELFERYILGEYTLDQIASAIAAQEEAYAEFVRSRIVQFVRTADASDAKPPVNLVTFKKVSVGGMPPELILKKLGAPPPPGTSLVWSGMMMVSNERQQVCAYRAT